MTSPVVFDELDRHLPVAGSIERALVPMGMYVAWCANLQLLDTDFQARHESAVLRVRYREISPAEFFTSACGGHFDAGMLSEEGQHFTHDYYERYLDDFCVTFDTDGSDLYTVKDDWAHYEQIAAVLTRRYMSEFKGVKRTSAKSGARWWKFWR